MGSSVWSSDGCSSGRVARQCLGARSGPGLAERTVERVEVEAEIGGQGTEEGGVAVLPPIARGAGDGDEQVRQQPPLGRLTEDVQPVANQIGSESGWART